MKDLLLIEGLIKRDKIIFNYIFSYYYSSLCAYSMHYIKDRDEIEDLVQDFFVTLWMKAPELHIHSSLKSYLFTGIKNRCLDFQKHHKVCEKYRIFSLFSNDEEDNSFEHYFAESELRLAIEKSMKKLSPRCCEIFGLSRINGLSNQEISNQLGISKRTIELQISNSLKVLKKELIDFLPLLLFVDLLKDLD